MIDLNTYLTASEAHTTPQALLTYDFRLDMFTIVCLPRMHCYRDPYYINGFIGFKTTYLLDSIFAYIRGNYLDKAYSRKPIAKEVEFLQPDLQNYCYERRNNYLVKNSPTDHEVNSP